MLKHPSPMMLVVQAKDQVSEQGGLRDGNAGLRLGQCSTSCLTLMVTQGYHVWVNSQGWRHTGFHDMGSWHSWRLRPPQFWSGSRQGSPEPGTHSLQSETGIWSLESSRGLETKTEVASGVGHLLPSAAGEERGNLSESLLCPTGTLLPAISFPNVPQWGGSRRLQENWTIVVIITVCTSFTNTLTMTSSSSSSSRSSEGQKYAIYAPANMRNLDIEIPPDTGDISRAWDVQSIKCSRR